MEAEGTRFVTGVHVGTDLTVEQLRSDFDAVVIATGATVPRDLPVPGRELTGIYSAMEYLVPAPVAGILGARLRGGDAGSEPVSPHLRIGH